MISMLHMAARRSQLPIDGPLGLALREFGEVTVMEHTRDLTDAEALVAMRQADVLLTMWGARFVPAELADDPGRLRYILNLTGTCKGFIPAEIIRSGIPVTNWGDAPANAVAEGAMTLLLTVLKQMRPRIEAMAAGRPAGLRAIRARAGTLRETRVGLYGCGNIGSRFVELIRPFGPELLVYDPYAPVLPADCRRVDSLEALFDESEVVVILAALTDETRGSVDAGHLARLPDCGILVNVARGEIVDNDALGAELESGRLSAGLDVVTANDSTPPDWELSKWPNLVLTPHDINASCWPDRPGVLRDGDKVAIDNLRRFLAGEPLRFLMDERRYDLSS